MSTPGGLYRLEDAWRELSADTEWQSPFHSWDFGVEWFERFVVGRSGGATGKFQVIVAIDERRRMIGLAPLFEESALGEPGLGLVLQPFGRSHSETMTDEPIALLRRSFEDRAMAMLVGHLATQSRAAAWDIATLRRYGSPLRARSLLVSIPSRLNHLQLRRQMGGPLVVELPSSFERFKGNLSKSMRDNIAYYPRLISREVGPWSVEIARSPDEVAHAATELIDLHRERSRWSDGCAHRDHIDGERGAAFLRGLLGRLSRRGKVNIARVVIGGEVASLQAFLETGNSLAVYYSGQAKAWRRYSPLTVATAEVLRQAIGRGIRRLIFAPGLDAWKTRWGAGAAEPMEDTSIYRAGVGQVLRGLRRRFRLAAGSR